MISGVRCMGRVRVRICSQNKIFNVFKCSEICVCQLNPSYFFFFPYFWKGDFWIWWKPLQWKTNLTSLYFAFRSIHWIWEQINLLYSLLAAWKCLKNISMFSAEIFPSCLFFMGLRHWCNVECNLFLPHHPTHSPGENCFYGPHWWMSKYLYALYSGPRFSLWSSETPHCPGNSEMDDKAASLSPSSWENTDFSHFLDFLQWQLRKKNNPSCNESSCIDLSAWWLLVISWGALASWSLQKWSGNEGVCLSCLLWNILHKPQR